MILLTLHPLLTVLVVLFLIPWISRRSFGEFTSFLRDLHSLFRAAEESKKLGPTGRSVPDMTKLFLSTINRGFPALSRSEERIAVEGRLVPVPAARQALDLNRLVSLSKSLQGCICLVIEDNRMNGLTRNFSNIVIHETAIADYKNLSTLTKVCIVNSADFPASLAGESVKGSEGKARAAALAAPHQVETSVTPVLVHAQSVSMKSDYQKIVGISYSYCGAPLQCIDARIYPFCKSALVQTDSMVRSLEETEFQTLI